MFWENDVLSRAKPRSLRRKQILDFVIILLLVITVVFWAPSAHADSSQSQIVDNTSTLTEYQLDTITAELSTLKDIDLAIILNDVGERCTDDYAYSLAKSLHKSKFSDGTNGMVIVYCNALEGYKLGIYYQGDFKINTKKLKNEIVTSYNLYSTDSAWLEGSVTNCIKSLKNITNPSAEPTVSPTKPTEQTTKGDSIWAKYGKYQLITSILGIAFVAGIITAIIVYRKHRKQIDKDIDYWIGNKEE